ncbi:MAG: MFS transporter [Sulfurifustaceae bacterium]
MEDTARIRTTIPARLDSLPWSRWHWRVVLALGITWLLDGLEVTMVGSIGPVLLRPDTLGLSATQLGSAASAYVAGAVVGAIVFGRMADRFGRKRLFLVTLAVYVFATTLTGLTWDFASFAFCRFLTGFGIGGEYAAINSAIDELIPARVRGRVDLGINGTFWVGAAAGALLSVALLHPAGVGPQLGWRLAFLLGAIIGVAMVIVRRNVPESPRWLITHGHADIAEAEIQAIEHAAGAPLGAGTSPPHPPLAIRLRAHVSWTEIAHLMAFRFRRRALLGLSLMATQAFFYNAIFFTYGLVLTRFYAVPDERVGRYILPFAVANFLGPLVLGSLFDTVGRRRMIAVTYAVSGLVLLAAGYGFLQDWLTAGTLTLAWAAIFFVASAAASSAYLTVSEIFPLEMRAISISIFYAVGTAIGGFFTPAIFGALIDSGSREALFYGYAAAGVLMCAAAAVAIAVGIDAERKPLEAVAEPLSSA